MNLDQFLQFSGQPDIALRLESGTVVSTRIRLARNVAGHLFPGRADEAQRAAVWTKMSGVLPGLKAMTPCLAIPMEGLGPLDRQVLLERHLISREQCEKGPGSGVVVREDQSIAIMVNEEDHLRMQAISPGMTLQSSLQALLRVDAEIEEHVRFAFSPKLGYLTACPTNVGTGLRASVMLHLPALALLNEINPIIKGMGKIGLAVRGLWGEGTEASGNLFQISNQITLGDSEEHIVASLEQIVLELVEHEQNAGVRLMESRETVTRDQVGRAFGVLSRAYLLNSKEALDMLSTLSLGIRLGILKDVGQAVVDELLLLTQPAHLQKMLGKNLKPKDRDRARAELVRSKLAGAAGSSGTGKRR